ncbi:MAG: YIP1 family protein [Defluviitaleaceae bacterium]|nr:YIP1 family protein [Defluviitaleaceae bacterium]MCL2238732.1 YIP1 family protein [Defluviitaleaceae bacterium]
MSRAEYFRSLRYCLYTMRRPLTGFWDLIHEKKGTMAAAHTLIGVAIIVQIMSLVLTNFQFNWINMETFSAWIVLAQVLIPVILWVVANWCLTTLFDGKGKMSHIYMGLAYAHAPMILINALLIPVSHMITFEEGAFYWTFATVGTLWFVLLVLCAMKEIHDYSFGKTIITSLLTIFAIGVMLFIFMMFFAVVSDGVVYFYSLYQEVAYR